MSRKPASTGRPPDRCEGFEVGYLDAAGVEQRLPLERACRVRFEDTQPVRSFPSYRGQRNYPGLYWSATVGGHVGFESWLERDHAMALDFDPTVVGFSSQPMWLFWKDEAGRRRSHAPDFFARLSDGSALMVDSRPEARRSLKRDQQSFAASQTACDQLGWRYALWGELDEIWSANLRWLAGYRHARCFDGETAVRLLEYFSVPGGLMAGAESAGDPIATLPVLYHLLWRQDLVVDLTVLLGERTIVHSARSAGGQ